MSNSSTNSAHPARATLSRGRAWPGLVILMLAPLWLLGMFDRGLWTPDEPREADIAWRMSTQSNRAIPELAGTPFLEKPPLTYWLSAAATTAFGDSPAAARLPNLLYALMVALATGALALAMDGAVTALLAALLAGSALIAYRVSIWLAPDAALLAGSAVALWGVYLGYTAQRGMRKLLGYTLMSAGAAFGFMAKSAPGWLVPGLALVTLIVWERRWSELRRWELYAAAALQVLWVGPWIFAVAASPAGAAALRVFLWDNLVGRFADVATSPGHDYAHGHLNWWGKYLCELPVYLLPWTVFGAAALQRAWQEARSSAAAATRRVAWRFAVSACLPFLALLSLAATARDVYAAPAMLGFALLIALWANALPRQYSRLDAVAFIATRVLVAGFACAFATALGVLAVVEDRAAMVAVDLGAAALVLAAALITLRYAARLQRDQQFSASIIVTYCGYALCLVVSGVVVLPAIDRWQDLGGLAQRIERDAAAGGLGVLNPDETTIAMLDYRTRTAVTALTAPPAEAARVVAAWLHVRGSQARVLVLLPGHAPGAVSVLLSRWWSPAAPGDGIAGDIEAAGSARITARYELPQGRRYALIGSAIK